MFYPKNINLCPWFYIQTMNGWREALIRMVCYQANFKGAGFQALKVC